MSVNKKLNKNTEKGEVEGFFLFFLVNNAIVDLNVCYSIYWNFYSNLIS